MKTILGVSMIIKIILINDSMGHKNFPHGEVGLRVETMAEQWHVSCIRMLAVHCDQNDIYEINMNDYQVRKSTKWIT